MTTVAANRELMAADSNVDCGGSGTGFKTQKIYRINNVLYGMAGDGGGDQFLEWAAEGFKLKLKPNFNGYWDNLCFYVLELSSSGLAYWDKHLSKIRIKDDCYSIGSGSPIALLLMRKFGYSPEQAVLEACEYDEYTKGPVDVLYLEEPQVTAVAAKKRSRKIITINEENQTSETNQG